MIEILQNIANFFSLQNTLFSFMGQSISALEICSTLCGLLCVFFAVKGEIFNFWLGYLYNILLFCLFLQAGLYSSMLLQPISIGINFFGHYRWTHPKREEQDEHKRLKVTVFNNGERIIIAAIICIFMFIWGYILSRVDLWLPQVFALPAQMPYFDAFVLGTILMAQYLSAQKKLDCWGCWLIANLANMILCLKAGFGMMPIVYIAYFGLAVGGLLLWLKAYKKQHILDLKKEVIERQKNDKTF